MKFEQTYPRRLRTADLDSGPIRRTIRELKTIFRKNGQAARVLVFTEGDEWVVSAANWRLIARTLNESDDERWQGMNRPGFSGDLLI